MPDGREKKEASDRKASVRENEAPSSHLHSKASASKYLYMCTVCSIVIGFESFGPVLYFWYFDGKNKQEKKLSFFDLRQWGFAENSLCLHRKQGFCGLLV